MPPYSPPHHFSLPIFSSADSVRLYAGFDLIRRWWVNRKSAFTGIDSYWLIYFFYREVLLKFGLDLYSFLQICKIAPPYERIGTILHLRMNNLYSGSGLLYFFLTYHKMMVLILSRDIYSYIGTTLFSSNNVIYWSISFSFFRCFFPFLIAEVSYFCSSNDIYLINLFRNFYCFVLGHFYGSWSVIRIIDFR